MKLNSINRVLFFDIESTGLDVVNDRIVELAVYDPANENNHFVELVNPTVNIPGHVINVHGINNYMVAHKENFSAVFERMKKFCGEKCYLVAHNGDRFDQPMLRYEARRYNLKIPNGWEFIDSLVWSKKYLSYMQKHNLQYLREFFKIQKNNAHRALDDTIVLYKVFNKMTDDLDIKTIQERLYGRPEDKKINFGKYKGTAVSQLPSDYIGFLFQAGIIDAPENISLKKSIESLKLQPRELDSHIFI